MNANLRSVIFPLLVGLAFIAVTGITAAQENVRRATVQPFDEETLKAAFSSVVVRQNDAFAASKKGLFRASLEDKCWKPLPMIDRMPVDGTFGRAPEGSQHLFYHTRGFGHVDSNFDRGLYHSTDAGQTWSLISKGYDFQDVYLHRDGSLYAIIVRTVNEPDKTWFRWCILHAPTLHAPLKWVDITGDLRVGVELIKIIDDPAHPELVRLHGHCGRSYIIHADDMNYRWQMTFDSRSERRNESDDAFLSPVGSARKILYLLQATVANYFEHPFGDRPEIHAWSIQTNSNSFTFARDEPKIVPVSIRFLRDDLTVRIAEVRDALDCWAMHLVTPSGERVYTLPRGAQVVGRSPKKKDEYRARENLLSVDISRERTYRRSIDLGKLADFSQTGLYRLRLSYHSDWLAENDEWSGSFCGDILTITVR